MKIAMPRRRGPVSREYEEGKEEIDEKTRAALRRMGKVGSAVRWGYMSPSDTESEIDESMHKAMSRLGKKGAAVRWGKIPREGEESRKPRRGEEEERVPQFRALKREPEQFARHPAKRRHIEEEEEEEYPSRGRPRRMWPEEEEEEESPEEEEEEEEPKRGGRVRTGHEHRPISKETHEKLHRAGLRGASKRWGYDYESEEEEGQRPEGRRRGRHAARYWLR